MIVANLLQGTAGGGCDLALSPCGLHCPSPGKACGQPSPLLSRQQKHSAAGCVCSKAHPAAECCKEGKRPSDKVWESAICRGARLPQHPCGTFLWSSRSCECLAGLNSPPSLHTSNAPSLHSWLSPHTPRSFPSVQPASHSAPSL